MKQKSGKIATEASNGVISGTQLAGMMSVGSDLPERRATPYSPKERRGGAFNPDANNGIGLVTASGNRYRPSSRRKDSETLSSADRRRPEWELSKGEQEKLKREKATFVSSKAEARAHDKIASKLGIERTGSKFVMNEFQEPVEVGGVYPEEAMPEIRRISSLPRWKQGREIKKYNKARESGEAQAQDEYVENYLNPNDQMTAQPEEGVKAAKERNLEIPLRKETFKLPEGALSESNKAEQAPAKNSPFSMALQPAKLEKAAPEEVAKKPNFLDSFRNTLTGNILSPATREELGGPSLERLDELKAEKPGKPINSFVKKVIKATPYATALGLTGAATALATIKLAKENMPAGNIAAIVEQGNMKKAEYVPTNDGAEMKLDGETKPISVDEYLKTAVELYGSGQQDKAKHMIKAMLGVSRDKPEIADKVKGAIEQIKENEITKQNSAVIGGERKW